MRSGWGFKVYLEKIPMFYEEFPPITFAFDPFYGYSSTKLGA
jgi:hypothetical protein